MNSGHATNGLVRTIASGSVGASLCCGFDRFDVERDDDNERMSASRVGRRLPDTIA
jgi:hypothetical protein